jgi:uncharacterized protein YraI
MGRWRRGWALGLTLLTALILLSGLLPPAAPVLAQSGQAVYALPGTLRQAENQNFDTLLVTFDGSQYGLLGKTPEVEQEIVRLRALGPTQVVKVWGTLYPNGLISQVAEILVDSILGENPPGASPTPADTPAATATPTPVATPAPAGPPTLTVVAEAVNVRSGPGMRYRVVTTLGRGTVCPIAGRNQAGTWWLVGCTGGISGWIHGSNVRTTGNTAAVPVVIVAPPPTPVPTPVPTAVGVPPVSAANWRVLFYPNRDLAGSPVRSAQVGTLDFNWGNGAPGANVPADNFSARFDRVLSFAPGTYEIRARADDGVRVWVDGALVLDSWIEAAPRTVSVQRQLSGSATFRVEYFEAYGGAQIQLVVAPVASSGEWRVSYYDNPNLAGSPVFTGRDARSDQYRISHSWQDSSPVPGIVPTNRWSARWEGTFNFRGGDYHFTATVDDGIRLYLDGIRVLDTWTPGYHRDVNNSFYALGPGNHRVTVEYYDDTSGAFLHVNWYRINDGDSGGNGGGGGRDE